MDPYRFVKNENTAKGYSKTGGRLKEKLGPFGTMSDQRKAR